MLVGSFSLSSRYTSQGTLKGYSQSLQMTPNPNFLRHSLVTY